MLPRVAILKSAAALGLLGLVALVGCQQSNSGNTSNRASASTSTAPPTTWPTTASSLTTTSTAVSANLRTCPLFGATVQTATLQDPAITEASGIAASRANPGMYWVHNDSGDSARVFATDLSGAATGRFTIDGATARDWEDIAVGPGPAEGSSYLYLGDIGGNKGRSNLSIYRAVEPGILPGASGVRGSVPAERIDVLYPDGLAWNAEALLVDPLTADIYVVTKSGEANSIVYQLAAAQAVSGSRQTLRQVASLELPLGFDRSVTGGDISSDGSVIMLRTYNRVYLWPRLAGESISDAFTGPPCSVQIQPESQGEAAAFQQNGRDLVLTTEGQFPAINTYPRR
ncbi:unannotated protein [freshwater metagenome]|uniref:Unannotated protein n=1 Tax=freshwater metagenome TaxID=449393 RepID=A0A6J6BCI0_9ZZZZ|nr:hypothetical protein [Actinomycetota bacterium]